MSPFDLFQFILCFIILLGFMVFLVSACTVRMLYNVPYTYHNYGRQEKYHIFPNT